MSRHARTSRLNIALTAITYLVLFVMILVATASIRSCESSLDRCRNVHGTWQQIGWSGLCIGTDGRIIPV